MLIHLCTCLLNNCTTRHATDEERAQITQKFIHFQNEVRVKYKVPPYSRKIWHSKTFIVFIVCSYIIAFW